MDLQSHALNFATGWIRFWFPWVRFMEKEPLTDPSWDFHKHDKFCIGGVDWPDCIDDYQDGYSLKTHELAERKHRASRKGD